MKFILYHPVHFEEWDYRAAERGIGGSETNQIEMAWRLASRGHEVISYAPIPKDCERSWKGTEWRHLDEVDWSEEGIWVIYRSPSHILKVEKRGSSQIWLMCQDEWYGNWTEEQLEKVDRVMPISWPHAELMLDREPRLRGKLWITANGVKMDLIRKIEAEGKIERNPKKLIYASSPDRGLFYLLNIFKKAKEYVPDLELHVFYGFNNIDKLVDKYPHFRKSKTQIEKSLKQPGVVWHGRTPQIELYKEWLSAGIWCYPTNFFETSCITSMEAQCLGGVPITNPYGALSQNVKHGIFIEGDAWGDKLVQARYVGEIVRLTTNLELQENIRKEMMAKTRHQFNWERVVDQWEASLLGYENRYYAAQYNFQLKNAKGRVLNIGCDVDAPEFGKNGAVNLDILKESPIIKMPTAAHIIADARYMPEQLFGQFDTVIVGDMLEHLKDEDAVKVLKNSKKALENGGYVVVTVPNDNRPFSEQHEGPVEAYHADESSFHVAVPFERLNSWVESAGMKIEKVEKLDYTFSEGFGVLCK